VQAGDEQVVKPWLGNRHNDFQQGKSVLVAALMLGAASGALASDNLSYSDGTVMRSHAHEVGAREVRREIARRAYSANAYRVVPAPSRQAEADRPRMKLRPAERVLTAALRHEASNDRQIPQARFHRLRRSECSPLVVHRRVGGPPAHQTHPNSTCAVFRASTASQLSTRTLPSAYFGVRSSARERSASPLFGIRTPSSEAGSIAVA
jgi:hypothetical protein